MIFSPVVCTAGELLLNLPLDCVLGETCYIQQYVDHDPSAEAADYTCGTLSYDGHKGTDFALPSMAAMQSGVDVLAAAPGTVVALRDGMPDTGKAGGVPEGRACGNGIVVRHGGGWVTQYCHLRQGSIAVTKGQRVAKGRVLGQVGFSGQTEFPHLHMSVRQNDQVIDPFAPAPGPPTCAPDMPAHMWQHPLPYQPGGLIAFGLADHLPDYTAIKAGTVKTARGLASELFAWGYAFGGQAGDQMRLTLHGPDGTIIDQRATVPRTQAQYFRAARKKRPTRGWETGQYEVRVELIRDKAVIDAQSAKFTISP